MTDSGMNGKRAAFLMKLGADMFGTVRSMPTGCAMRRNGRRTALLSRVRLQAARVIVQDGLGGGDRSQSVVVRTDHERLFPPHAYHRARPAVRSVPSSFLVAMSFLFDLVDLVRRNYTVRPASTSATLP